MKYFTPDLFVRLQQCQEPEAFRLVNAEWERAVQQYRDRLQEINRLFPAGLRRFLKRRSLHDAHVQDIGTTERWLTMILQEEAVPRLLSLVYALVDAPVIDRNALPDEFQSHPASWLYDEVDIDPDMLYHAKLRIQQKASAVSGTDLQGSEWKPIFLHSILLSNGWEIRLRFHGLRDTRTKSLIRNAGSCPAKDLLSHSG